MKNSGRRLGGRKFEGEREEENTFSIRSSSKEDGRGEEARVWEEGGALERRGCTRLR